MKLIFINNTPISFEANSYVSDVSRQFGTARYSTIGGDGSSLFARKNLQIKYEFQQKLGPFERVKVKYGQELNFSFTGPQADMQVGTGVQLYREKGFELTNKAVK